MIETIVKRDGREVGFDIQKIANAINKAFIASIKRNDEDYSMNIAKQVEIDLEEAGLENPSVEQIQDAVEKALDVYKRQMFMLTALRRRF